MVYRFAHGISPNHIANCLKAKGFHYKELHNIVWDIFTDEQKLFNQCFSIQDGAQLESIISSFKALTRLPNVASAFDGTHIMLAKCCNGKHPLQHAMFSTRKNSTQLFCNGLAMLTKSFGMFVQVNLGRCMMTNNSRCPTYTRIWKIMTFCKNQLWRLTLWSALLIWLQTLHIISTYICKIIGDYHKMKTRKGMIL